MSIKVMTLVFETTLPGPEKLTLLALADFAHDDGGSIFPAVERIATKATCSDRTVQRHLRSLEQQGVLVVVQPATHNSPTHYRIVLDAVRALIVTPGVTNCHPSGDTHVTSGVTPMSPNPSVDPSMNRQRRERARGWRRVPPTEQLTEDRRRMAWETNNLTRDVAAKEWAAMKDHEFQSPRKDVDAAWRNWCRKVRAPLRPPPPAPGKRTEMRAASPSDSGPVRMGKIFERVVPSAKETRTRFVDEDRRLAEEDVGL
jgi:hypothetical protein